MKMFLSDADVTNHIYIYIVHSGVINAATVSERRRMIMDTEVETLPSKSTRQEGYVEAKHCLCIELLTDVNERATRIFAPQVRVSDHMLDSVLCINTINCID